MSDGATLHEHGGFLFVVYPRQRGRAPELDSATRSNGWAASSGASMRSVRCGRSSTGPRSTCARFGDEPFAFLLEQGFIPPDLLPAYESVVRQVLAQARALFRAGRRRRATSGCTATATPATCCGTTGRISSISTTRAAGRRCRTCGCCCRASASRWSCSSSAVLRGYREFYDFDLRELHLIEALRTLRLIHYSGWLARRWDDPAFPLNFPWFNTQRYWQDQILALREQSALMHEPPLHGVSRAE